MCTPNQQTLHLQSQCSQNKRVVKVIVERLYKSIRDVPKVLHVSSGPKVPVVCHVWQQGQLLWQQLLKLFCKTASGVPAICSYLSCLHAVFAQIVDDEGPCVRA